VLLGRLGPDRLTQQGRDWMTFAKSQAQGGCRFFPETGHNVCGEILAAWRANGLEFDGKRGKSEGENLALFGLPLSDEQTETIEGKQYVVQWFERARFERHPENAPPFNVLLGLLGNETLKK
jgi:polysaccharide biosynthesis protein PslG